MSIEPTRPTPPLALQNLPPVSLFRARFVAVEPQRLPPLPTTALHGAFGTALRRAACLEPSRATCRDCPHAVGCAYPLLCEPTGQGEGVTDRAPAPVVFASERIELEFPSLQIHRGSALDVRVALIGAALQHRALVASVLTQIAQHGLGIGPRGQGRDGRDRPRLRLESFEPWPASSEDAAVDEARLTFLSPVRLKAQGRIASSIDVALLWRTLLRRADTLARTWGSGPLFDGEPPTAGFDAATEHLEVVDIGRFSARQNTRMTWPGLVGALRLSGPGLRDAWPLLRFGERVQLGKATSFGFGRYRLEALREEEL